MQTYQYGELFTTMTIRKIEHIEYLIDRKKFHFCSCCCSKVYRLQMNEYSKRTFCLTMQLNVLFLPQIIGRGNNEHKSFTN